MQREEMTTVYCTKTYSQSTIGQLGIQSNQEKPGIHNVQELNGKNICHVSCGTIHVLFLSREGQPWSVGYNQHVRNNSLQEILLITIGRMCNSNS